MAALIKPTTLVRDPMILEQLRTALTVAHGVAVLVAGLQNHPMAEFYIPDAAIADGRIPVLRESTLTKATAEPTPSCCSMRRIPTRAWRSSRTTMATPLTFRWSGTPEKKPESRGLAYRPMRRTQTWKTRRQPASGCSPTWYCFAIL